MKYEIEVCRISYASHKFTVEADNEIQANNKALADAGDHIFSEYDAKYEVEDIKEVINQDV